MCFIFSLSGTLALKFRRLPELNLAQAAPTCYRLTCAQVGVLEMETLLARIWHSQFTVKPLSLLFTSLSLLSTVHFHQSSLCMLIKQHLVTRGNICMCLPVSNGSDNSSLTHHIFNCTTGCSRAESQLVHITVDVALRTHTLRMCLDSLNYHLKNLYYAIQYCRRSEIGRKIEKFQLL